MEKKSEWRRLVAGLNLDKIGRAPQAGELEMLNSENIRIAGALCEGCIVIEFRGISGEEAGRAIGKWAESLAKR